MQQLYKFLIFFSCLLGISSEVYADVKEILYCYEMLRSVNHRNNGEQAPIVEAIKKFQIDHPEAFLVQKWPIADDQVVQVGLLDIALISLKCQEILLTAFLAQEGHLQPSNIPEFEEYEREKALVDLLRLQNLEQHLTDGEMTHYAELLLKPKSASL